MLNWKIRFAKKNVIHFVARRRIFCAVSSFRRTASKDRANFNRSALHLVPCENRQTMARFSPSILFLAALASWSRVAPVDAVLQLSAGATHVCAVLDHKELKCWGSNAQKLGEEVSKGLKAVGSYGGQLGYGWKPPWRSIRLKLTRSPPGSERGRTS